MGYADQCVNSLSLTHSYNDQFDQFVQLVVRYCYVYVLFRLRRRKQPRTEKQTSTNKLATTLPTTTPILLELCASFDTLAELGTVEGEARKDEIVEAEDEVG